MQKLKTFEISLKMSSFKCSFCIRTFTTRSGLSKHMSKCVISADDDEHVDFNISKINQNNSKFFKSTQDNHFTEKNLDSIFSSKKISFNNINFRSNLKTFEEVDINNDEVESNTFPSNLFDTEDAPENLEDMSFELEDNKNIFEVDPNNDNFNIENSLQEYKDLSEDICDISESSEDIRNNSDDDNNNQKYDEFPNEAYADLMVLVTKYNLSNATGNAIISFFNKHSNYSTSPLPKNIQQGKQFMNNMKSNLSYKKTKVLDHDNTEYFLYHMPLISCIKNILEVPDISQNFVLEYEELYKTTKV